MIRKQIALSIAIIFLSMMYTNCSNTTFTALSSSNGGVNKFSALPPGAPINNGILATGPNVAAVTVGCGYINEPCVSVQICVPGTAQCQTINNILLDTGSYGLRLFSSVVTLPLPQQNSPSGGALAECVSYADGTSQWGPVKIADVTIGDLSIGTETAPSVPIMIDDANYVLAPSDCTGLDSPTGAGYNGILGVGLLQQDCGPGCANVVNNRIYFSCTTNGCSATAAPVSIQVTNPVAMMPVDNNGVILTLPALGPGGTATVNGGQLILGIGTKSNNTLTGATVFTADVNANFKTTYNGLTYSTAFIDSGSNGLFFQGTTTLPECTATYDTGFFCPVSSTTLNATMMGATGTTSENIPFTISSADSQLAPGNPNVAYSDLGGAMTGTFDWGLPFFFGRSVHVGIEGKSSFMGTGPYWAF